MEKKKFFGKNLKITKACVQVTWAGKNIYNFITYKSLYFQHRQHRCG